MDYEVGYRRSRSVEVDGGTIDVRIHGGGPMVVMIPSLGRGADDFDDLGARLAARGYMAVMPEPRGIGATTAPLDDLGMTILAADVAAVIRSIGGTDATAHVVGHAFGNRVARMTATEHPQVQLAMLLEAPNPEILEDPEIIEVVRDEFVPEPEFDEVEVSEAPLDELRPADAAEEAPP